MIRSIMVSIDCEETTCGHCEHQTQHGFPGYTEDGKVEYLPRSFCVLYQAGKDGTRVAGCLRDERRAKSCAR